MGNVTGAVRGFHRSRQDLPLNEQSSESVRTVVVDVAKCVCVCVFMHLN